MISGPFVIKSKTENEELCLGNNQNKLIVTNCQDKSNDSNGTVFSIKYSIGNDRYVFENGSECLNMSSFDFGDCDRGNTKQHVNPKINHKKLFILNSQDGCLSLEGKDKLKHEKCDFENKSQIFYFEKAK